MPAAARRVLVVEGSAIARTLMRRPLSRAGWEVIEADTGSRALALAREQRFDVLLMGSHLPDVDGGPFLEEVRSRAGSPPVVALVGEEGDRAATQLLAAGASDYLTKARAPPLRLLHTLQQAALLHDPPDPPEDPLHVLIVDDSTTSRAVTQRIAHAHGWKTSQAADGATALAMARARAFDAILMDYQLPDVDGIETTRELRRAGVLAPIIALTGDADPHVAASFLRAGATDYLEKADVSHLRVGTTVRNAVWAAHVAAPR